MKKRTITGAVITVAVYLVIAYSHIPSVTLCATAFLSAFAVSEIFGATGRRGITAMFLGCEAAALLLTMLPIPGYTHVLMVVFPLAAAFFMLMMKNQHRCSLDRSYKAAILSLIVVVLFKAIPQLRICEDGFYYLTGAVTLCFATDVAAFLVGSRFGHHKLIPKVSPNKTVEGSAAGIAASVLVMLGLGSWLESGGAGQIDWIALTLYAATASIVGQFGDLAMSAVKRVCAVKDFGNLLPGHGGILDRFDSHLFCIAYTLLYCRLTGGFIQ